jgi:hypothetical protein
LSGSKIEKIELKSMPKLQKLNLTSRSMLSGFRLDELAEFSLDGFDNLI